MTKIDIASWKYFHCRGQQQIKIFSFLSWAYLKTKDCTLSVSAPIAKKSIEQEARSEYFTLSINWIVHQLSISEIRQKNIVHEKCEHKAVPLRSFRPDCLEMNSI